MYLDPKFTFYEHGQVSNTFYFTFTVKKDALKNGLKLRNVVPATEEEARRILERMDAEKLYDGSQ
jgi:acyl-coenzyme A thioesterase 9